MEAATSQRDSSDLFCLLLFTSVHFCSLKPVGSLLLPVPAGMPLIADLQVLPSPPGTGKEKWKHVDAAIKVIAASKLKYSVNALGTVVEGPAAKVWSVCRLGGDI